MSADNISDCPQCGEHGLREYHEMYWEQLVDGPTLIICFRCICKNGCGFTWDMPEIRQIIPVNKE